MSLFNFFFKKKSSKQDNSHGIDSNKSIPISKQNNVYEINPNEFILISKHLINSFSTTHKLLGIIMASGIPLTHLKNVIKTPFNFKDDLIFYQLSNGLRLVKHSLICSNTISRCIENLDKNILPSVGTEKINYIAKNIFDFRITTKQIRIIHSLIATSKTTLNEIGYNSNSNNILLVNKPCILNLYQKICYIKSFEYLKPNKNNLNYYKNNPNRLTSTIANLIENFLLEKEPCKNLYNLKLYINSNLKNLGIHNNSNKLQKQIISKIFLI
ncbi:hypothetical protein [Borreliella valaisiana]|uniref:hypothetical protein n=1 Tax=Borreliella valaisiana TaxID=62088 RepID=UPI001AEE3CF3|nr:hypothetical protein [Borreliella valaisiana]